MKKRPSTLSYGLLFPGIFFFSFLFFNQATSQTADDIRIIQKSTHVESLQRYAADLRMRSVAKKLEADDMARKKGWVIKQSFENGQGIELKELDPKGRPVYFSTANLTAAKTVSANKVWNGGGMGLNLNGTGVVLREWDESVVRPTHQEYAGRVTQGDAASGFSAHSTHVAGTMIATGVSANAHGMSNQATLRAFDWNTDYAEMAVEASAGALLSNASYVYITGWFNAGTWYWYGDPSISQVEDYFFGFYTEDARIVDSITYSAPYYLPCRAAGNDRGEGPATQPISHYVYDGSNWVLSTTVRNLDGMPTGYDCITYGYGTAKNIITVGAVSGIPAGYSQPSDVILAGFSCTGPTDDGRIKPDIVADGVNLYSTYSTADNAYASMTGTSMATPNAVGSLGLLQQHFKNLHGVFMLAATLKGLAIHTADEAGTSPGPDYRYGWGLLDIAKAASLLSNTTTATVKELTLANGQTYTLSFKSNGTDPVRATICWTDPPGTPPAPSLNPPDIMLVNDLDLRIDGSVYKPWILDPLNRPAAATTGDNIRDNVEQILTPVLAVGCHTLTVTHKGTLSGGAQAFSLILSGITVFPPFVAGIISGNQNICSNTTPAILTGIPPTGGNPPYSYQWQSSADSITFTNIPGATGINYQPGILTATTWYRLVQSSPGSCESLATNVVKVRVYPLPVPSITGTQNLCVNSGNYTYFTEPGMTSYSWSVSSGGSVTSGLGTNTIMVVWNTPGAQTITVTYISANGCAPASATILPVTVNPLPGPAGNITGTPVVCSGSTGVAYSVAIIPNAVTYIWTLPPGATISSGLWTSSILADFPTGSISGNIVVTGNNQCGDGIASSPFAVTVSPVPPQPEISQQGDSLVSDAPAGNQWYDVSGSIAGATYPVYTPSVNGMYRDIVTLNGCSSNPSEWINFVMTGISAVSKSHIRIYPNPAIGSIRIEIYLERTSAVSISLMSLTGTNVKIVNPGNLPKGVTKMVIDCNEIREGIYFLKVTTDSDSFVQKVILKK
ncbi:MAG: S8 family serine peptidase [Bacteroidetes bacterium]|nr:S8 family serine peptidase [Bacteroidota bacterium]